MNNDTVESTYILLRQRAFKYTLKEEVELLEERLRFRTTSYQMIELRKILDKHGIKYNDIIEVTSNEQ